MKYPPTYSHKAYYLSQDKVLSPHHVLRTISRSWRRSDRFQVNTSAPSTLSDYRPLRGQQLVLGTLSGKISRTAGTVQTSPELIN